jgi:tripartite-type tricarboxylate transporter receptor subunit TctC
MHLRTLLALLGLSLINAAVGQTYPNRPIRFVSTYAAGGPVDLVARPVAQRLYETMGQPVIIESRPGANGNIGADLVAKSTPDGYTLLLTSTSQLTINPSLYSKLPFDVRKDFAPVTLLSMTPTVLVLHPSVPAASVRALVAMAKAQPDRLRYASAGSGSINHLSAELFRMIEGVDLIHVPYKGGGPALTDVVAGQVDLMIISIPTTLPFIKAGRLKALAVSAAQRYPALPEVPTMAEAGTPGFQSSAGVALMAPAAAPKQIVARLNAEIVKALNSPDIRQKLLAQGVDLIGNTPEELSAILSDETERWAKVIKAGNIRPE